MSLGRQECIKTTESWSNGISIAIYLYDTNGLKLEDALMCQALCQHTPVTAKNFWQENNQICFRLALILDLTQQARVAAL